MTENDKCSTWKQLFVGQFLLLVLTLNASCAQQSPHENFKSHMADNLGKREDDPRTSVARYPERILSHKVLTNGNSEIEYRGRGSCVSFFEVDAESRLIISWRFVGNEKDCSIVP